MYLQYRAARGSCSDWCHLPGGFVVAFVAWSSLLLSLSLSLTLTLLFNPPHPQGYVLSHKERQDNKALSEMVNVISVAYCAFNTIQTNAA